MRTAVLISILAWMLAPGWAAQVTDFSPLGNVESTDSVRVNFDERMAALGAQGSAPLELVCNGRTPEGQGRWTDPQHWTFVFAKKPGPGTHCTATLNPALRSLGGDSITGPSRFEFRTSGPTVTWSRPYGSTIDEDQVFVLGFNAPMSAASVREHSFCLIEGLGEQVPVRVIAGALRDQVLDAAYVDRNERGPAVQVLQCARLLPSEARVSLHVGEGAESTSGVAVDKDIGFEYEVRTPFKATFNCQREHAGAACIPLLPVGLEFSAPISAEQAGTIRLNARGNEGVSLSPDVDPRQGSVDGIRFEGPFPPDSELVLTLPDALRDDAGRVLSNAEQFPLKVAMGPYPPLVKFARAPFGIVERFANVPIGGAVDEHPASVPVTVRHAGAALKFREGSAGRGLVRDRVSQEDGEVLLWMSRLPRLEDGKWTEAQLDTIMAGAGIPSAASPDAPRIDARSRSVLAGQAGVRELVLPDRTSGEERSTEVVGIPLDEPGFHVLEIESPSLGASLLDKAAAMYVRTGVLVTNLAVHIKHGRDDLLVWVTSLDTGTPVAGAQIRVLSCAGEALARGESDEEGLWHLQTRLSAPDYCDNGLSGLYVSARIPADHSAARGQADFSFAFSDWSRGIEPWRFNVLTDFGPEPTLIAHTVTDRPLFHVGETVSMKHFLRVETRLGLEVPEDAGSWPQKLVLEHQGSGQRHEMSLQWERTRTGGLDASSHFDIPPGAMLGLYHIMFEDGEGQRTPTGEFRVEAFKTPLMEGRLSVDDGESGPYLIAPRSLDVDVQLAYISGGPAAEMPVRISGVLARKWVRFADYDDFSFNPEQDRAEDGGDQQGSPFLFLDKQRVVLDAHGGARVQIPAPALGGKAQDLLLEADYEDPNGAIQTLSRRVPAWPGAALPGIRASDWVRAHEAARIDVVVLSPTGEIMKNVPVAVRGQSRRTYSTRKRLVGGFYTYDSHVDVRDLGLLCEGRTDEQGLMQCTVPFSDVGGVRLTASATDEAGRVALAETSLWVAGEEASWFPGGNDDRMDVVPDKKSYRPGETAHLQVHMPFRRALALVAVEREGVLEAQVVPLSSKNPRVSVKIRPEWGPNAYVSVLALRGRIREASWSSFIEGGWRQPTDWFEAYRDTGTPYQPPTAFVDLAKPSFRFGLARFEVSDEDDRLGVQVSPERSTYRVGETAKVRIRVNLPDGRPAAHGQIAFAAVDEALLQLLPNQSWDLLQAMRRERGYGVETATAQMEVVGRRHYGRKALPSGGGGGKSPTRELLDTLLLWLPSVTLDQDGEAQLEVPLNDALTRFRLVAIADYGPGSFGTGSADIVSTQDLQLISGLPALVREGDEYDATVTLRNTTSRPVDVELRASYAVEGGSDRLFPASAVSLESGSARSLRWSVRAPVFPGLGDATSLQWHFDARQVSTPEGETPIADRLEVSQTLIPAVPTTVRQAMLEPLDAGKTLDIPIAAPQHGLADARGAPRGGIRIDLQSSLANGLPTVRSWFERYPYTCFEQLASRAIALHDRKAWEALMQRLPTLQDESGLLRYFPGSGPGSAVLTAYLLTASWEAQQLGEGFEFPSQVRAAMLDGLRAFVQGKIVRDSPASPTDGGLRKLMALDALSRAGLAHPRMLDSIELQPVHWPASALIDWLGILLRTPEIADRASRLEEVQRLLRAQLRDTGSGLVLSDQRPGDGSWLMRGPEADLARLILALADEPLWEQEMPRMVQGLLGLRSDQGAWRTTTANLLGTLAVEGFARRHEGAPLSGETQVRVHPGAFAETIVWSDSKKADLFVPWEAGRQEAGPERLTIDHHGAGRGWASVQALAAVPATEPDMVGYRLTRHITPLRQAVPGQWQVGDIYRVLVEIEGRTPSAWAVLSDPIPAGASILGSGLGRDSALAEPDEMPFRDGAWQLAPDFVERRPDVFRAYFEYLPSGKVQAAYTVRLNTSGRFHLPPTRVEALYQPAMYGAWPNPAPLVVAPARE